jgi:hypothetical protein
MDEPVGSLIVLEIVNARELGDALRGTLINSHSHAYTLCVKLGFLGQTFRCPLKKPNDFSATHFQRRLFRNGTELFGALAAGIGAVNLSIGRAPYAVRAIWAGAGD